MQYKALATLLFATAALAVPASDTTISPDDLLDDITMPIMTETIPSGILSVIETAIPSTWYQALETDSAFQSSVLNDILHSTYPAWYNSLPNSVKSWATAEGEAEFSALSSYFSGMPTVTPTSGSGSAGSSSHASSTPLSTGHSSTSASTRLTLTSTATQTKTASGSGSSSSSASGSGTSTSTGGAPAATGGLAISLAGAAGVLGLAFAL
ncbi:uncharacterized protein N7458_002836 [Penicillium daleae]|jgi:hypothetical protein|uniref:Uncharacterized protein n=1 Tax=Penicillium daleae TaxID=63821 RepID=A0AAD6CE85_9EURO|nr:uncharacterized protein N7458_002836 [Penicillium daleae]KAJ5461284.1 hypothetical protein N7458_002836 [Penicillium daleae]